MTDSHYPSAKKIIMMVDDNADDVDFTCIRLESEGFIVRCAYSGKDLFASLEKEKPDLILLDILMPQMDGLEVLKRLKGAPETSSIPIIMLTALVRDEDKLEAHKLGADYYIRKPFTASQLLAGVNRFLREDHLEEVSQ